MEQSIFIIISILYVFQSYFSLSLYTLNGQALAVFEIVVLGIFYRMTLSLEGNPSLICYLTKY